MGRYKVIGPRAVAGVEPGGTVELDEARVNVPALLSAGHVEPMGNSRGKPGKAAPLAVDGTVTGGGRLVGTPDGPPEHTVPAEEG